MNERQTDESIWSINPQTVSFIQQDTLINAPRLCTFSVYTSPISKISRIHIAAEQQDDTQCLHCRHAGWTERPDICFAIMSGLSSDMVLSKQN